MKNKILIDDSGWGFPIGGVLCGAYNAKTKEFKVKEIPIKFFQEPLWSKQTYLDEFARAAIEIIAGWDTNLKIEICTGWILSEAYKQLKGKGFTVVRTKVGEPLQTLLESAHKKYIKSLGYDHYYDPKNLNGKKIAKEFYKVIRWVKKNKKEKIAKTGWKYFNIF